MKAEESCETCEYCWVDEDASPCNACAVQRRGDTSHWLLCRHLDAPNPLREVCEELVEAATTLAKTAVTPLALSCDKARVGSVNCFCEVCVMKATLKKARAALEEAQ